MLRNAFSNEPAVFRRSVHVPVHAVHSPSRLSCSFISFACLEMRVRPFWNWDQRAIPGIAASSGFMDVNREHSEAAKLDPLTARQ